MKYSRKELNTYEGWKAQGYQVKKDQHAAYSNNHRPLFSRSQVIKKRASNPPQRHHKNIEQPAPEASSMLAVLVVLIILAYWYLS